MSELTCGSLFSGVGGMDIGFAWAGWRHAFFAEIEPFGRAVLAERFPDVPIYSDVRDVPECGSGIPWGRTRAGDDVGRAESHGLAPIADDGNEHGELNGTSGRRLDVLTFGSPCQDLSVAGKRRGLDGDRSGLFWEAMRIAGDGPLRPRALLMENVEGLLSSNGGRDFALVLDAMAERGYRWSYRVLDSQHFGVPQRRRRVFVVGIADDDPRAERIGEVLALAEGGGGDSQAREPSWPDVAARIGAGAPSSSGGEAVSTFRDWKDATDLVAIRERERERSVVSALTSSIQNGADVRNAQAGHLIVEEKS
jgi:DNA (cytosine-5)-methyltransferase 1